MKKSIAAAVALAIGLSCAGAGFAAGSAEDMISARQAEMKTNMAAMKVLVSILKGETAYDAAVVKAAAKSMTDAQSEGEAKGVWDATTQTGATIKSGAKPEIWSDAAGFSEAWKNLDVAVAALAATQDEASFKAAFPAIGAACKGCHEKFRAAE